MVHFSFKGGTEEGGGRTEHFLAIANNCVRGEESSHLVIHLISLLLE